MKNLNSIRHENNKTEVSRLELVDASMTITDAEFINSKGTEVIVIKTQKSVLISVNKTWIRSFETRQLWGYNQIFWKYS